VQFIPDFLLKSMNTLALPSKAEWFVEITSEDELREAIRFSQLHHCSMSVLGGGSNVLLPKTIPGLVAHINLKGWSISFSTESKYQALLRVAAGENWHSLVRKSVKRGYYGLENLSLIPGSAGAAPVQNIGAYGVELADILDHVKVMNLSKSTIEYLSLADCQLGYRNSLFKEVSGKYVILEVALRISKQARPTLVYPSLKAFFPLADKNIPSALSISDAVIKIRQSKLPNPEQLPNAGSFYKNPIINQQKFLELLEKFPDVISFPQPDGNVKLAAGWLIEKAGWKGYSEEKVGIHCHQALVIVNHHGGDYDDIVTLSSKIISSVEHTFGIYLEPEPVDFSFPLSH